MKDQNETQPTPTKDNDQNPQLTTKDQDNNSAVAIIEWGR